MSKSRACDGFATASRIIDFAEREVVAARARVADESDAEKRLCIERAQHQDGTVVFVSGADTPSVMALGTKSPPVGRWLIETTRSLSRLARSAPKIFLD